MAEGQKHNVLENIIFGIGLLLTLSVIGYLIFLMATTKMRLPDLQSSYKIEQSPQGQQLLHVKMWNKSGRSAENVNLEVWMKKDTLVQKRTIPFHFLPSQGQREVYVPMGKLSNPDSVRLEVLHYEIP